MTSFRRLLAALAVLVAVCGVGTAPALASPSSPNPTPNTDSCPYRLTPPKPIDSSEAPKPGQTAPPPVPLPAQPVGGPQLSRCGAITAPGTPALPADITAAGWVLADLDSGQILAAKDPHGRHRPASTIKTLLAILALQNLDLDKVVVGTQADADADGSRVGIGPGGRYTNRQLMQGLLMNSGNDAAHAVAAQFGGDAATVAKENALAHSLGALDTRTATPSGLDGPGMATSAYDLALLFRHAMAIPAFAELVSAPPVMFPGYPSGPGRPALPGFMIANDNQLLANYPGALGGKTGYTDDAGQTYIGAAEQNGRRLVVTLMQGTRIPIAPWQQAARLLDYGFAQQNEPEVGRLVDASTQSAPSPAAPTSAAVDARAAAQRQPARAGQQVNAAAASPSGRHLTAVYGLILLVGAVLLAGLVWRRARRPRRRSRHSRHRR